MICNDMYNKLFTKILDSSIWLESTTTRIVWLTFIAAMDEAGFVQFAGIGNVAARARVTTDEAHEAIRCLESVDAESSNPDNNGRRIERVPGGWMVLNASTHREMVTRAVAQEQNRERVRKHREKMKRSCNGPVMQSEALSGSRSEAEAEIHVPADVAAEITDGFEVFWKSYPKKVGKGDARKVWATLQPSTHRQEQIRLAVAHQCTCVQWLKEGGQFIPNPATWLRQGRWDDEPETGIPVVNSKTAGNVEAARRFLEANRQP